MLVGYLLAFLFVWANQALIAAIVQGWFLVMFVFEFLFYWEILDHLTPHRTAANVYGVIDPAEEIKNVVVFSGHHDSTHVFNFFDDLLGKPACFFLVREILFIGFQVGQLVYTIYAAVNGLGCGPRAEGQLARIAFGVLAVGIVVVVPFWWFLRDTGTPGAGDNLISSVMGVQLAKFYGLNRPKHTRLIFLSFDAEELGLKGSRVFFRRHKKELHEIKTWNFNVDCPYTIDELKFLTRDINGFKALSAGLAGKLADIARGLGYSDATTKPIMFLGGGTDAAEAARVGIEATTLLGLPFGPKTSKGKEAVYHTHKDTIDEVEPVIVKATLEIFRQFVDELDNGQWPL
jgi:hypothetical protein